MDTRHDRHESTRHINRRSSHVAPTPVSRSIRQWTLLWVRRVVRRAQRTGRDASPTAGCVSVHVGRRCCLSNGSRLTPGKSVLEWGVDNQNSTAIYTFTVHIVHLWWNCWVAHEVCGVRGVQSTSERPVSAAPRPLSWADVRVVCPLNVTVSHGCERQASFTVTVRWKRPTRGPTPCDVSMHHRLGQCCSSRTGCPHEPHPRIFRQKPLKTLKLRFPPRGKN